MFAGPMNPGAALIVIVIVIVIVKSCGPNISANVRDGALSQIIYHLAYFL